MRSRQVAVLGCLLAVVLLAGCSAIFGTDEPQETLTQVPLDDETPTATASPTATMQPEPTENSPTPVGNLSVAQSRYRSLRPTCDRPPEVVIHIQVTALKYNDPQFDEGINTTFQFASPDNRRVTGPLSNFKTLIKERYQPLLNAESVTYGTMTRENGTASQRVTVETADGLRQAYMWRLERQSGGEYDGCWLTTSVSRGGIEAPPAA